MPTIQLITTAGAGTWTPPGALASLVVECWGCGANGFTSGSYHPGGGGGAYARKTFSGPFASSYGYYVGQANGDTTSTWFSTATTVAADYAHTSTGGSSANCYGDLAYSGGPGGAQTHTYAGGGSGAGSTGAGNPGSPSGSGGAAVSNYGGAGGNGASGGGQNGFNYGGGGGGATSSYGQGAQGLIRITYTLAPSGFPSLAMMGVGV